MLTSLCNFFVHLNLYDEISEDCKMDAHLRGGQFLEVLLNNAISKVSKAP